MNEFFRRDTHAGCQTGQNCHRSPLVPNLNEAVQSPARVPEFLHVRRVSCFTTCFVNTPWQRNLIPSFINSRITFSPSWLIVVICFISITSSRPRRFALASSQALLSSATQGARSFPSTTSRRCVALSISEIFSIASSYLRLKQGAHQACRAVSC